MSGGEIVLLGLVGGLLAWDQDAGLQTQCSQPLVAAGLAGAVLGRFEESLLVGVVLQALWVALQPIGGARLPDAALAGMTAAMAAGGLAGGSMPHNLAQLDAALTAPVLLAVVGGELGGGVIRLQHRLHERWIDRALRGRSGGALRRKDLHRIQRNALVLHALRGAGLAGIAAATAPALAHVLQAHAVHAPVLGGVAGLMLVTLGPSVRRRRHLAAAGGALGVLAMLVWMGRSAG